MDRHLVLLLLLGLLAVDYCRACTSGDGVGVEGEGEGTGEDSGEGEDEAEPESEPQRNAGDGKKMCSEQALHTLVDKVVDELGDTPRECADGIQAAADQTFGGKFEAIVSDCDFAYADYYLSDCHVKTKTGTGQYVLAWKNQE